MEGSKEPMINLLAWCYKLRQEYDFPEPAQELEKRAGQLKSAYGDDINSFNNVLTFLLCLKDLPKKTNNKLVIFQFSKFKHIYILIYFFNILGFIYFTRNR